MHMLQKGVLKIQVSQEMLPVQVWFVILQKAELRKKYMVIIYRNDKLGVSSMLSFLIVSR